MSKYDIVIIGSGLGGMECAYILAKEGYKVCLLEKNRQLGGNLQIFVRDKVIFDTGVHYIGGLDEGQNLYRFFSYLGLMDKLKLRRMDESGFDRVTFDNDPMEYPHAMGYERFYETLAAIFPNEREGLKLYCDKLQEACDSFPIYRVRDAVFNEDDLSYLNIGAKSFIETCVQDPKLRNVLAGTNALYAGYADRTPLYVHALVVNTYIESAWKCVDGGAQIARLLAKGIKDHGGEIYNYCEVSKIEMGSEGATAVLTTDGRRFEGKQFISNIHPVQTLDMIEEGFVRKSFRKRIAGLDNSISIFTVHIVFKPDTFEYLNYNYYHSKNSDAWAAIHYTEKNWPENYIVFVPASSKSGKYADSMNVMSYMRYEEVEKWAHTLNVIPHRQASRGADYQEFKQIKAEKLLTELEKKFPGIRDKIQSYHVSTPLSYRDYIGTSDGSMYGIAKDYNNPMMSLLSPRTQIPNLFLTGQNLNMHGMLGVTVGAIMTCSRFLGLKYIMQQISKH
ncbi:MAG: NAD(P)/FAD-dependent oxidoreductase [Saprospiraceae bacterium]|nr:NAD(P)/FAD-dependent oxidoreductase [Saprospiraceae bacterium]